MYGALLVVQASATRITQATVLLLVAVSALFVIALLLVLRVLLMRTEDPLKYGNFFVVALGIMASLIGFLVAFPLIISGVFSDPTQVPAILSALFGTIVGLVGTYFGVKASSDATKGAQDLASETSTRAAQSAKAASQSAQVTTEVAPGDDELPGDELRGHR